MTVTLPQPGPSLALQRRVLLDAATVLQQADAWIEATRTGQFQRSLGRTTRGEIVLVLYRAWPAAITRATLRKELAELGSSLTRQGVSYNLRDLIAAGVVQCMGEMRAEPGKPGPHALYYALDRQFLQQIKQLQLAAEGPTEPWDRG